MTEAATPNAGNQSRGQDKPKFESIAAAKSPTMVTQFLKGIKFPATQAQLLERVKQNGAPDGVVNNVDKLPEGDYLQMIDVTHNLGKVL